MGTIKKLVTCRKRRGTRQLICFKFTNEFQHSDENFKGLIDTHFPKAMPVLFMLSEASPKELPDWGKYHEERLGENPGYMVMLGEHHYLHLAVPKKTADEMDSFMEKYVLQTGALPTSGRKNDI